MHMNYYQFWFFNEETSCCQSWKDLNFNRIRSWPRILNMERGPLNYHKHYSKLKTSPYKLNVFFLINEQAFYTADVLTYSVMVLVNPASLHNIRSATPNWWTVINFTNLHLYFFTYTGVCVCILYILYIQTISAFAPRPPGHPSQFSLRHT